MTWTPELIIQLLGAGGVTLLLQKLVEAWTGRGKARADAATLLSGQALAWSTASEERARHAEQRAADVSDRLDALESRIARCAGGVPCPLVLAPPSSAPPSG